MAMSEDTDRLLRQHDRILELLDEAEDITVYRELQQDLKANESSLRAMGVMI